MIRSAPLLATLLAIIAMQLLSGCGTNRPKLTDNARSPGRLMPLELQHQHHNFTLLCVDVDMCKQSAPPISIGHEAGAYRTYAQTAKRTGLMGRGWGGGQKVEATPIAELVDSAFDELDLTGIEVDLHTPVKCARDRDAADCIYVLHDEPRWSSLNSTGYRKARDQLEENTLRALMKAYLPHRSERRLYLELKVPDGCSKRSFTDSRSCVERLAGR